MLRWRDVLTIGGTLATALSLAWLVAWAQLEPPAGQPHGAEHAVPAGLSAGDAARLAQLPVEARAAYAFALERPDVLRHLPCYCGCVALGHTSLLTCFVRPEAANGPVLELHGAGCVVCQEEAAAAKALLGRGASLAEVRREIDARFGGFGPGTETPPAGRD